MPCFVLSNLTGRLLHNIINIKGFFACTYTNFAQNKCQFRRILLMHQVSSPNHKEISVCFVSNILFINKRGKPVEIQKINKIIVSTLHS